MAALLEFGKHALIVVAQAGHLSSFPFPLFTLSDVMLYHIDVKVLKLNSMLSASGRPANAI